MVPPTSDSKSSLGVLMRRARSAIVAMFANELLPALMGYLERAGGAVECSVKEERIAAWWMSDPDLSLPPIVESVKWSKDDAV